MFTDVLQVISINENTQETVSVRVVGDREMLVMIVTPDGDYTARNISE